MVSQAEREQQRRYIIQKAYAGPPPLEGWHVAREDERPGPTVERMIAAARRLGWTVSEMACTDWHAPRWQTVEGREAVYVAAPRRQYHLLTVWPGDSRKALRKAAKLAERNVAGLQVVYVDGVKFSLQVGYADLPVWVPSSVATNSIAKFLTENGVPRS